MWFKRCVPNFAQVFTYSIYCKQRLKLQNMFVTTSGWRAKMPVFFFKEIGILNPQKAGHQCHQFQTLRNPEKGKFHPDFVCFFWGGGRGVTKKQEFGRHFGSGNGSWHHWQFSCFLSRVEGIDMGDWRRNRHSTNTPGQFKDIYGHMT